MQNIDKISMAVAGAILLLGFIVPLLREDAGAKAEEDIRRDETTIAEKMGHNPKRQDAPRLQDDLAREFQVPPLPPISEWAFYRKPAYLRHQKAEETELPVHDAPIASRLWVEPDEAGHRFVFLLAAQHGVCHNVAVEYFLETREGTANEWLPVGADGIVASDGNGVDPITWTADDPITIGGLEAGKEWAFRIKSTASSTVDTPLEEAEKVKYSNETDPRYLPKVENWYVTSIQEGQIVNGVWVDGGAIITREWWDFSTGSERKKTNRFTEPKPGEPTKLYDTEWEFVKISRENRSVRVELRNKTLDRSRRWMYLTSGGGTQSFEVSAWEAEEPAPADGEEGGVTETPKPSENKPKEKKKTSGLFGGDN